MRGDDVVTYDIDCPEWIAELERIGYTIGAGIYSDICDLDSDDCKVNIGIGYKDYHNMHASADLNEYNVNLIKFVAFFARNHDNEYIATNPYMRYGKGSVHAWTGHGIYSEQEMAEAEWDTIDNTWWMTRSDFEDGMTQGEMEELGEIEHYAWQTDQTVTVVNYGRVEIAGLGYDPIQVPLQPVYGETAKDILTYRAREAFGL